VRDTRPQDAADDATVARGAIEELAAIGGDGAQVDLTE
jgi:hypothetical protein